MKRLFFLIIACVALLSSCCNEDFSDDLDTKMVVEIFTTPTQECSYRLKVYNISDDLVLDTIATGNVEKVTPPLYQRRKKNCYFLVHVDRLYDSRDTIYIGVRDNIWLGPDEAPSGVEGINGWSLEKWWLAIRKNTDFDYNPYMHLLNNRLDVCVILPEEESKDIEFDMKSDHVVNQ